MPLPQSPNQSNFDQNPLSSDPIDLIQPLQSMEVIEEEEQTLPLLPKPTSSHLPTHDYTFDFSTDDIGNTPIPSRNFHTSQIRKRPLIDTTDQTSNKRNQPTNTLANTLILEARTLIVKAASIAKSHDEQTSLLDLLEVFRQYTEKGKVTTTSRILATQVANLKSTTRRIESKAKELAATKPPTLAQIATSGLTLNTSQPQQWQLVEKKKPQNTQKDTPKDTQKDTRKHDPSKRLILVQSSAQNTQFSPLSLRNKLNQAFLAKGFKELIIILIKKLLT